METVFWIFYVIVSLCIGLFGAVTYMRTDSQDVQDVPGFYVAVGCAALFIAIGWPIMFLAFGTGIVAKNIYERTNDGS